jgi:hypothetical protein
MSESVKWDESIIGKWERFLIERFPIGPMWARALPSSLVSAVLWNVKLLDKMGIVKPNAWWLYIAPSGLGCKTPPLRLIRNIAKEYDETYNDNILSVAKFTPEGFTEWVTGRREEKDGDVVIEEGLPPHYANFIIRDEMSKLISESLKYEHMATILEFLSELWDGWIESYYTRKMKLEGNLPVYVTLLSTASDYFLTILDEKFFRQGVGNRILWVVEEPREPVKLNGEEFFFGFDRSDVELERLKRETFERLHRLETLFGVFLLNDAAKMWAEFEYKTRLEVSRNRELSASFKVKQPLNALKLAMIYSASRLSADFTNKYLIVEKADMERAIEDVNRYYEMWVKAMDWWRELKGRKRLEDERESAEYMLKEFIRIAIANGGLCCLRDIKSKLLITDSMKIIEILEAGVARGWLKIAADTGQKGELSDEEYERFKPPRGPSPRIYRVTEEGRRAVEKL